jgi:hypothetical protein
VWHGFKLIERDDSVTGESQCAQQFATLREIEFSQVVILVTKQIKHEEPDSLCFALEVFVPLLVRFGRGLP